MRAEITVPGRTRWALNDPDAQALYVNIADPVRIPAKADSEVQATIELSPAVAGALA